MKSIAWMTFGLCFCLSVALLPHRPIAAQDSTPGPRINLSATNQPLAEILDQMTAETGYQFNLSPKWGNHRVSATLYEIPLERGLKRLLRSLNHSIIWESDRIVTILVYGRAEPERDGGAISFAPPPREIPSDPESAVDRETEPDEPDETVAAEKTVSEGEAETGAAESGEQSDEASADR